MIVAAQGICLGLRWRATGMTPGGSQDQQELRTSYRSLAIVPAPATDRQQEFPKSHLLFRNIRQERRRAARQNRPDQPSRSEASRSARSIPPGSDPLGVCRTSAGPAFPLAGSPVRECARPIAGRSPSASGTRENLAIAYHPGHFHCSVPHADREVAEPLRRWQATSVRLRLRARFFGHGARARK